MFLEMQVSLASTLVHPSVTLSEFHSVSVSHGGAHGGRHGGRKKKKIWPTWSWTWWPTKKPLKIPDLCVFYCFAS